jgi:hypothetical protein
MTEKQEYKILSVRLKKEHAEQLEKLVEAERNQLPKFVMSSLLRMIIEQWLGDWESDDDND